MTSVRPGMVMSGWTIGRAASMSSRLYGAQSPSLCTYAETCKKKRSGQGRLGPPSNHLRDARHGSEASHMQACDTPACPRFGRTCTFGRAPASRSSPSSHNKRLRLLLWGSSPRPGIPGATAVPIHGHNAKSTSGWDRPSEALYSLTFSRK
jgi:hypothetical protein